MTNNTEITNCNCTAKTELEALRAENKELSTRMEWLLDVILARDVLEDCYRTFCQVREEYACLRDEEGNNIIEYAEDPTGYYFTEAVRRHKFADEVVENFCRLGGMIRGILDSGVEGEAWR